MKKALKKIADVLVLLFTGYSEEAVDEGICDYAGQGRDKYGN